MAGDIRIEEHLIVVSPQAHAKASAIADTADEQGARVIHRFGPRVMITQLPKDIERVRSALPDAEVAAQPNELSLQATKDLDPVGALGLAAFQLRQSPEYISAKERRSYDNVAWDCGGGLLPPDPPPELQHLAQVGAAAPTYEKVEGKTSQRMTGKIAVGIIIVSGPNNSGLQFSPEETTKVFAEVQEGLGWWASQNPAANITWIYDIHSVQIDVWPKPAPKPTTQEDYWRDAAMDKLGYTKRSSHWQDIYDYVDHIRSQNKADWAYVAYFTKYPLDNVAHAAFGGPRLVVQYTKAGPNNIDNVFAHETGHIFQAPDEYKDYCDCGGQHGIYNRPNANCEPCAAGGGVDCLMRKGGWTCCKWTAWHLGFPWPPGFTINDVDATPTAPAACVFNKRLYVFWRGPNAVNRIYYSSSSDSVTWPNGKTINDLDATPATPAVCVFNNKLYVFWQANDSSNLIYFSSSTDGVTWAKGQTINNVDATSVTPSACVFNNRLYLFWKAANESARISFSSSSDGVSWPKAELTKYLDTFRFTTLTAPSACVFNNKLFVFWKDLTSKQILFTSQDGTSWTGATSINGIDSTPEPPVPCVWNNKLYLFWTREDTSIYVSSSSDGSSWPAGKQINLVDSTRAALAAAVFQNYAYLFWKANNASNSIYYTA